MAQADGAGVLQAASCPARRVAEQDARGVAEISASEKCKATYVRSMANGMFTRASTFAKRGNARRFRKRCDARSDPLLQPRFTTTQTVLPCFRALRCHQIKVLNGCVGALAAGGLELMQFSLHLPRSFFISMHKSTHQATLSQLKPFKTLIFRHEAALSSKTAKKRPAWNL